MKNLKTAREQRGLTQEQLADMINVSRVTLARYEAGNHFPDEQRLIRLADCLDVSVDYLLGRVPMNVEVKYEKPPALAEGQHEVSVTIPDGLSQSELESRLEQLVQRLVRQELRRQSEE